ncbi:MAG: AsmA family protein [Deltaproteobacteria bacterium]|nr:AsmA family protein [Deltaproteobacteria bacterium]
MKKAWWIGLALFVSLAGIVLAVPLFVDLGVFKNTYLPLVEDALGRRVEVGEVRLGLVPAPSIRLANLKVSDGPAFPNNTFFATDQLQLRLRLWPLIRGRFEVTELVLKNPTINLLKRADGSFNYADLAGKKLPVAKSAPRKAKAAPSKPAEGTYIPLVLPVRMRIDNGQLNLQTVGQKPVRIDNIELSLEEYAEDQPFPYRAAFNYPGLRRVTLEGQLDYREDQATLTFTNNRLKVLDLQLPIEGNVSHLSTTPRVNLKSHSERIDAKPVFELLSVFGLAPKATEVSGPMSLALSVSGPSNQLVTEARGHLIDVKVNGKRALKGNLTGDVTIKLPLGAGSATRRLQGNGKVAARDGELTNVNLIKKVQQATGLIGLSKEQGKQATTFKNLESEFAIAGGSADFKRISLTNTQVEVNGNGTLTLDQPTLDMVLETKLLATPAARNIRGRTAALFKNAQGQLVVPLKVRGPLENPNVDVDMTKVAQNTPAQAVEKRLGTFLKKFFR